MKKPEFVSGPKEDRLKEIAELKEKYSESEAVIAKLNKSEAMIKDNI